MKKLIKNFDLLITISEHYKIIKGLTRNKQYFDDKLKLNQVIKLYLLLSRIKRNSKIIDLGCGNMWLTHYLRKNGYHCIGFSNEPPADIIGDVCNYKFKKSYYDVVIALEIVEHVDCIKQINHMLKPGGILIVSTPLPNMDWLCKFGEYIGLLQKRTSPHINLLYIQHLPFKPLYFVLLFGINQFGVFRNYTKN